MIPDEAIAFFPEQIAKIEAFIAELRADSSGFRVSRVAIALRELDPQAESFRPLR